MKQRISSEGRWCAPRSGWQAVSTLSDVCRRKPRGAGTTQVSPVGYRQAWDRIAKTVLRWRGVMPLRKHRDRGYMLTRYGMNFVSAGAE